MSIASDIKVIDVDTHVIEPYDLWTSRVSTKKWGDRVPHVVFDDATQSEMWVSGGEVIGTGAGATAAGWTEPPPKSPPRLDLVSPEVWRAEDRLRLMDRYGIYAAVLYPNVAGFGAGRFVAASKGDSEFAQVLLQAYNDFLIDFASTDPERYIPVMAVPFWDRDLSVKEMERAASMGHRGIIFSQDPQYFGQPMLSDPHWDPLWAAAQAMDLSVNFHIGGGDMSGVTLLHPTCGPHANYASFPVTFFVSNTRTIASLIGSGVCHRFPRLKFVSVESGVGWIPFVLQALDWMWQETHVADEHPEYDLVPTEYFRRQIYACFWFEHGPTLDTAIEYLGADHILYETDFPHPTSMSPGPISTAVPADQFIETNLGHLPEATLRKILHDNAASLYHLD